MVVPRQVRATEEQTSSVFVAMIFLLDRRVMARCCHNLLRVVGEGPRDGVPDWNQVHSLGTGKQVDAICDLEIGALPSVSWSQW